MSVRKPKIKIIDVINPMIGHTVGITPYSFVPKDVMYLDGAYWIGLQTQSWEQDEENWDNLVDGMWGGRGTKNRPAPQGSKTIIRQLVNNLKVKNATYQEDSDTEDIIAYLPSDITTNISFNLKNYSDEETGAGHIVYEIVNCNTGTELVNGQIVKTTENQTSIYNTPSISFSDGSYVARFKVHAEPVYKLPPTYQINSNYYYDENDVSYIYDPEYNIGRIPSDSQHELLLLRAEIVEKNEQKDKASWAKYLIGNSPADGEWSSIKIHVGSGSWSFDPAIISSVGPTLKRIDEYDLQDVVYYNFDPLMRNISSSLKLEFPIKDNNDTIIFDQGDYLFAGNRSTENGPILSLWHIKKPASHGDIPEFNLLATHLNPITGAGESSLLDHGATSIAATENGKIIVLTKSARYIYSHSSPKISQRLNYFPLNGQGIPGGQTLCTIGEKIYHFTENTSEQSTGGIVRSQIVSDISNQLSIGEGSSFHGPNNATVWMNKIWSIFQDNSENNNGKQYIAYFDGLKWSKKPNKNNELVIDSSLIFDTNDYHWQRVVSANNVLHLFGKRGLGLDESSDIETIDEAEDGIFGVSDGQNFRLLDIEYRILKITVCSDENTGRDKLIAIANKVNKNKFGKSVLDIDNYYIIEIDHRGQTFDFIFNKFDSCFISDQITEVTAPPPRKTICGPMDIAFVIDDTGSMGGSLHNVTVELENIIDEIEKASAVNGTPDYRLGLLTFKDDINVRLNFSKNNKELIDPIIKSLTAEGGGDGPEASDEAVNTAVNLLPASGSRADHQNIDFFPENIEGNYQGWRPNAVKIVILITDAPPGGFETGQGAETELMLEVATDAADKDILIASVQVGTGYNGGPELLQEVSEITGGSYLEVPQDGIGTGNAIQEIIKNCGGRSRPLNMLVIDEFPAYFWWVDGKWEAHDSLPEDPSICVLSRNIKRIEGQNYGYIAYCDHSRDRSPKNNNIFLYDDSLSGYFITEQNLKETFFVDPEYDLLDYLVWDTDKLEWIPSNTPTGTYLTKSISNGKVIYSGSLPYSIDSTNNGLQFNSPHNNFIPRNSNSPIITYNPNNKTFVINKSIVSDYYNLIEDDLPDYLIINEQEGRFDESSTPPIIPSGSSEEENNIIYLEKDTTDTDFIIYKLCDDCNGYPYDPIGWYSRGLIKREDGWYPVSYEPLEFVWNASHGGFFASNEQLNQYGITINNLPVYLVYGDEQWIPYFELPEENTSHYLTKTTDDDGVVYVTQGGLTGIYYDPRRWENKSIVIGESHYRLTSGEYEPPVVEEGEEEPELEIEFPFTIGSISSPIFIYDEYDKKFRYNLNKLLYDKKSSVSDLPSLLRFSTLYWERLENEPQLGQYLNKEQVNNKVNYEYIDAQGSISISLPYDAKNWQYRGIRDSDNYYTQTELNPPFFVWDSNSKSFTCDKDSLITSYGYTDFSILPDYLIYDSVTKCWNKSGFAMGLYLTKIIENNRIRYELTSPQELPDDYNLTLFPALKATNDTWCSSELLSPVLDWDSKNDRFYIDRNELKIYYGITDPTSLPLYYIYDGETCWNRSDEVNSSEDSPYLVRHITPTEVYYKIGENSNPMPYDPTSTINEGNALRLNWFSNACPEQSCPPYDYDTCSSVQLRGEEFVRGNMVDGEFVPCDCQNAWDCLNMFPEGTKWKMIPLLRHGLPINVFEVIDSNTDYRLEKTNKYYPIGWYRKGGVPYSGDLAQYLSTFNTQTFLGRIEIINKPSLNDIEVVILFIPKLHTTKLPVVFRLI